MISGIVLAAGAAKRMGQQKLFLDFKGKPVLQRVLEAAIASVLNEVVCVVRDVEESRSRVALASERLRWVPNERAEAGLSTSMAAGIQMISAESEACLFLVGDQPLVTAELINGLVKLYEEKKPVLIVAPIFQGQARNPVLFHKTLFPQLLDLTGDQGGRGLIQLYKEKAAFLEWRDEKPFLDVDTWKDYERLKGLLDG